MSQKRIIIFVLILIVILSIVPISWIRNLDIEIDWIKFTEEWYKSVLSLLMVLFGFIFFEYLTRKNTEKQTKKENDVFEKKFLSSVVNLNNCLSDYQNIKDLRKGILRYKMLLKYAELNSKIISNSNIIDIYVIYYEKPVEESFELLQKFSNGANIDNKIIQSIIHSINKYFQDVNENIERNTI